MSIKDETLKILIQDLHSSNTIRQVDAAKELMEISSNDPAIIREIILMLLIQLKSEKQAVLQRTINMLIRREPASLKPLILALSDKQRRLRKAAAKVLINQDLNQFSIKPDISETEERKPPPIPTISAAITISCKFDSSTIYQLIKSLSLATHNYCQEVRRAAVKVLGIIQDPRCNELLLDLMQDQDHIIRYLVIKSLENLLDFHPENCQDLIIADALINSLYDRNQKVRHAAIVALRKIPDLKVIQALIPLQEKDQRLRPYIINTLVSFGILSIKPLIQILKSKNIYLHRSAIEILASLLDTYYHKTSDQLDELNRLKINLDMQVIRVLSDFLKEKNVKTCKFSLKALALLKYPNAIEILLQVLERGCKELRKASIEALGIIGGSSAVIPLLEGLKTESNRLKRSSIKALENLVRKGSSDVIERFIQYLTWNFASLDNEIIEIILSMLINVASARELKLVKTHLVTLLLTSSHQNITQLSKQLLKNLV
ncbi:MAG: HEAT repeat domain-containing protein [Candidatus Hermodarchaeota archaeon]